MTWDALEWQLNVEPLDTVYEHQFVLIWLALTTLTVSQMHISMIDFGSHYDDPCKRIDAKPKQGELLNKVYADYCFKNIRFIFRSTHLSFTHVKGTEAGGV